MGNSIRPGRKKVKVMTITGETFKLKTPAKARDATTGYPGHILLDSESVQRFGVHARPLDPEQPLKPNKLYFLVQLPDDVSSSAGGPAPRRVRSGVHMSAKDRLECLMLSRRSVSEIPITRSAASTEDQPLRMGRGRTVRMRLSKAQMAELVEGSRDEAEVAEKVLKLYMAESEGKCGGYGTSGHDLPPHRGARSKAADLGVHHERRVRFDPMESGEIEEVAASL